MFATPNQSNGASNVQDSISPKSKAISRRKFTKEEDINLTRLVKSFGENNWSVISSYMKGRNVRQCRERWYHYLCPSVSNSPWTQQEDFILNQKYAELGPQWIKIAEFLPSRTYIMAKNRFLLKQRQMQRIQSLLGEATNQIKNEEGVIPEGQIQNEEKSQEIKEDEADLGSFFDVETYFPNELDFMDDFNFQYVDFN